MKRMLREDPDHKIGLLLDFIGHPRDIADPWYTGDFDATYRDVREGCEALLEYLQKCRGESKMQKVSKTASLRSLKE